MVEEVPVEVVLMPPACGVLVSVGCAAAAATLAATAGSCAIGKEGYRKSNPNAIATGVRRAADKRTSLSNPQPTSIQKQEG